MRNRSLVKILEGGMKEIKQYFLKFLFLFIKKMRSMI